MVLGAGWVSRARAERAGEALGMQARRWARRRGAGRAGGRLGCAAGARPRRWARGLGAGRAAWARGLALASALGALGPFSIRFDSFFFLSH